MNRFSVNNHEILNKIWERSHLFDVHFDGAVVVFVQRLKSTCYNEDGQMHSLHMQENDPTPNPMIL